MFIVYDVICAMFLNDTLKHYISYWNRFVHASQKLHCNGGIKCSVGGKNMPLVKTKMEMLNLLLLIISSSLQCSFKKQLNGLRLVSKQCSGYNYYYDVHYIYIYQPRAHC